MLSLLNSLAVSFDLPILDWIQITLQSGFMDFIMPIITVFGDAGIFWMIWATLLLIFPKTRRTGLGMWFAMAMGLVICNMILKPVVGRIRPYDFQIQELGKTMGDLLAGGELLVADHGLVHTLKNREADGYAQRYVFFKNDVEGRQGVSQMFFQCFEGLENYIVGSGAGRHVAALHKRTVKVLRRRDFEDIAPVHGQHYRADVMVAVGTTAKHLQTQVYFGIRE